MLRRSLLTGGAAAAVAVTAEGILSGGSQAAAGAPHSYIPDVEVVDQDGRRHRFYTDLVRDRVVMINFFFTACGDTCPLVTENLRAVQDLLGDRIGKDIFMLSVSLQPELETPEILKDYAQQWDVKPGWSFLTGRPADIERLRVALGFADSDPEFAVVRDSHTGLVRYGNDRRDQWAGTAGLARPAWIVRAVTSIAI